MNYAEIVDGCKYYLMERGIHHVGIFLRNNDGLEWRDNCTWQPTVVVLKYNGAEIKLGIPENAIPQNTISIICKFFTNIQDASPAVVSARKLREGLSWFIKE